MDSKVRLKVVLLASVVAAAIAVGILLKIRHDSFRVRQERERKETEEFMRTHQISLPGRDFRNWLTAYGAHEPDPATPAGRRALAEERTRLGEAETAFVRLMEHLPTVWQSADDASVAAFLGDVEHLPDGFSRAACASILSPVRGGVGKRRKMLENMLERTEAANRGAIVTGYYQVFCSLVDMLWTKCGLEYEAAEADYRIYETLDKLARFAGRAHMDDVEAATRRCIENWKQTRCDSASSNFCRSHEYWEDRYHRFYEERVRRGETHWLRALSGYYRFHLELAREILGRNPVWAPK